MLFDITSLFQVEWLAFIFFFFFFWNDLARVLIILVKIIYLKFLFYAFAFEEY